MEDKFLVINEDTEFYDACETCEDTTFYDTCDVFIQTKQQPEKPSNYNLLCFVIVYITLKCVSKYM
jgi:hypothetical protein